MEKQTLDEIIREKNEERVRQYKRQASELVSKIVEHQESIVGHQRQIITLKKDLSELEQPKDISVEL